MPEKRISLAKAINMLQDNYERAQRLSYVRKPISYALYETWKYFDSKEKERKP